MTSSVELKTWLENAAKHLKGRNFIIITNRYRKTDGGEKAANNLIKMVHSQKEWKSIPIIVFCGNTKAAKNLEKSKCTKVTDKATDVLSWCTTLKKKPFK